MREREVVVSLVGGLGNQLFQYAAGKAIADQSGDVFWQPTRVTREQRANQKSQKPCVLWFTGLSGSGKSTVANALEIGRAHV